jgi:hypothetical protein
MLLYKIYRLLKPKSGIPKKETKIFTEGKYSSKKKFDT